MGRSGWRDAKEQSHPIAGLFAGDRRSGLVPLRPPWPVQACGRSGFFKDADARRDYLILSQVPRGWEARDRNGTWKARSRADLIRKGFDLRDRKAAAALARVMAEVDLSTFDEE